MKNSILLLFYTFFCSSCFCVETNNNERNFKTENSMKDLFYFSKESTIVNNNPDFESFLMQFDLFKAEQLDISFFYAREQRDTEIYSPDLNESKYSSFIPYDNKCDCDREDFCYKPCYRIETTSFHFVCVNAGCDNPIEGYPFCSDILVTYDKMGNIIDYEIVGSGGDLLYYNIEFSTEKYEFVCTQYSFYNINSKPYTGKCDVSIYKVTINDNGTIDKEIIRNYTDNITLSID